MKPTRLLRSIRRRAADEQEVAWMAEQRGRSRPGGTRLALGVIAVGACACLGWACRRSGGEAPAASPPVALRLGISQVSTTNPTIGLRQLRQHLDGGESGTSCRGWPDATVAGRKLDARARMAAHSRIKLRPNVTFQDGTPVDAEAIANILPESLRSFMGPIRIDVEGIRASDVDRVELTFKHSSPFLLETLENPIRAPGHSAIRYRSLRRRARLNDRPSRPTPATTWVSRRSTNIDVTTYPTVRAAWAELLRDRIDMLWEVDPTRSIR